ncbi:MAG: hypothetical protein QM754_09450 [Tepidisphaeraceae bacterium]
MAIRERISSPAETAAGFRRRTMIAWAAAIALATPALAADTTTTSATDWHQRIRDAVANTGSAEAVWTELAAQPADADTLRAIAEAALEDGEVGKALTAFEALAKVRPNDAAGLQRLARVQEISGQSNAAMKTLAAAATLLPAGAARGETLLRQAALNFDAGQADAAVALLKQTIADDTTAGIRAGIIAYAYGRYADAAAFFDSSAEKDVVTLLLQGNAALKAGDAALAAKAFTACEGLATRSFDRAYAVERIVATARQEKRLSALADAWLTEPHLPPDRTMPLATMLRELGRVPDLLKWWKAAAINPAYSDAVLSDRFVNEVIGAARSAGLTDDAYQVCRALLDRDPTSWQWLTASVRAALALGKTDDADALLRQRLTAVDSVPENLGRLGRLARDFGRSGVGLEAADRLRSQGGASAVTGCLLAASVHDRTGDATQAKAALDEAARLAENLPASAGEVAAALEAADMDDVAIALIQSALKQSPDDSLQSRLASLLIKNRRYAEAIPVLETVLRSTASPAVKAQAAQRLLEAAKAGQSTADLIRRTKDRLDTGHGDATDLSLLVDALLSQKQFDAAVDALRSSPLLDDLTRLRRLSVLFLRENRLDQAEATLKQLAKADPAAAAETQERLASIAIQRKRPNDATAAIDAIARLGTTTDADSLDRMAGVLNRLGRTAEAAVLYRRLIAAQPDNADNWLLWSTAMSKTGKAAVARRRLTVLCGDSQSDNVFAAASDALLNLNAPPDMLRVVRRDAVLRLSQRPARMMLNHVLADLSDELADPQMIVRATELGIAVSDEERSQRLRQLMDVAAQNGLLDTAIDCGRSLLALGDEFPPQLFMQLAERLLIAGRPDEAAGAVSRAAESADPDFVAIQSGKLLEQYAYPQAAYDAWRPLKDRRAVDDEFQQHLAALAEETGHADEAYTIHRAMIDRLLRDDAAPASDALGRAVISAISAARTEDQRQAVLNILETRAKSLISDQTARDVPPANLVNVAKAMRTASVFCDQLPRADRLDRDILGRWPTARAFVGGAVEDRLRLGLPDAALAFARSQNAAMPPALSRYAASGNPPSTQTQSFTVKQANELLPLLMVRGDFDRARAVLSNLQIDAEATSKENVSPGLLSPFRTLIIAANALNDRDTATRLALTWADTFEKPSATTQPASPANGRPARASSYSTLPNFYMALVSSSWNLFPDAARVGVIAQMRERLAGVQLPTTRATLSLYVLQLSAAVGRPPEDAVALGTAAMAGQTFNLGESIGRVFAVMPVADRPAFLRVVCDTLPANRRLAAVLGVVAKSNQPFDAATKAAILEIAAAAPAGQALDWNDWFSNDSAPDLLPHLADITEQKATYGDIGDLAHAAGRAAVAAALANAGEASRADTAAAEALASLAAYAPPTADGPRQPMVRPISIVPDRLSAMRVAIAALSPSARTATIAKLRAARAWTQADESWQATQLAVLLDTNGQRDESLATLRQAIERDPNDQSLITLYKDRLQAGRRDAELAKLAPRLAGSGWAANVLRQNVTAALRNLYRWREIPVGDGPNPNPAIDLSAAIATNNAAELTTTLRGVLVSVRNLPGTSPTLLVARDAGMTGKSPADAVTAFVGFPQWPGMADDVLRTLHSPALMGPSAEWLANLVTQAAGENAVFRQRLLAALEQARQAGTVSYGERITISLLAKMPDVPLSKELLDTLWPAAVLDPNGPQMVRFAETLAARSHSTAAADWAESANFSGMGRPGQKSWNKLPPSPFDALDDAVLTRSLLAAAERDPTTAAGQFDSLRQSGRLTPRMIGTRLLGLRLRCRAWQHRGVRKRSRLDPSDAALADGDGPIGRRAGGRGVRYHPRPARQTGRVSGRHRQGRSSRTRRGQRAVAGEYRPGTRLRRGRKLGVRSTRRKRGGTVPATGDGPRQPTGRGRAPALGRRPGPPPRPGRRRRRHRRTPAHRRLPAHAPGGHTPRPHEINPPRRRQPTGGPGHGLRRRSTNQTNC